MLDNIIIFRGKSIEDRAWLYGSLIATATGKAYIVYNGTKETLMKEVDPRTIGQYSGKSSKNGRNIYTGDILSFGSQIHADVTFENGCFSVFGEPLGWDFETLDEYNKPEICNLDRCLVVGNIHDNKEFVLWKPKEK